jgi:DNA-binding LacI/PurR family transcriptional regulator
MLSAITLKDISSLSGFSVSTVSKALNNRSDVNEFTKTKIREIAKKEKYVPNSSARALRNRKTNVIAVIVPKFTTKYFNTFVCEVQKKCFDIGYQLLILQSFNSFEKEQECINFITDGTVDGILILSNNKLLNFDASEGIIKIPFMIDDDTFNKNYIVRTADFYFKKLLKSLR